MKIIARERYYVRDSRLDSRTIEKLKKKYTYHFFEEKGCSQCEWVELRKKEGILGECEACACYKGSAILASKRKVGKNFYWATPLGDLKGLLSIVGHDSEVVEKHKIIKIKPIKFLGKLRDYQQEAVRACTQGEKGVLYAPPRSGKTVMCTALICKLGIKSLIIASQRDWLVGFYETFVGSNTQKPLTDIDKSRIGFCKKKSDFEKYDVCLATVQTFHSEGGQALLEMLRDKFTLVAIDEVHTSSANRYIQEISRFNCKYKIGLTGTPDRKDGKYVLTQAVVGPILYHANVKRLRPTVKLTRTKFDVGSKSTVWAYIVKKLETDEARLKLIAKCAIKDAIEGKHMVLIPFSQVKPILTLVKMINDMYGEQIAYPFYGGLPKNIRDDTIQKARDYKIKIIVGNMRLLGTGINIPRASAIYQSTLSSNIPQCEQRVSRILTPCDNKPDPILRIFLDSTSVSKACLRNEWFNCIRPTFKPIISDIDNNALQGYFREDAYQGFY